MNDSNIERLKELIAIQLDKCSKIDWLYVCHMNGTPEGKKSIEEMVLEMCKAEGCTVGQALERIERSFNPNKIED
jgi:uncharacterized protein YegJ (DUF2314 family)